MPAVATRSIPYYRRAPTRRLMPNSLIRHYLQQYRVALSLLELDPDRYPPVGDHSGGLTPGEVYEEMRRHLKPYFHQVHVPSLIGVFSVSILRYDLAALERCGLLQNTMEGQRTVRRHAEERPIVTTEAGLAYVKKQLTFIREVPFEESALMMQAVQTPLFYGSPLEETVKILERSRRFRGIEGMRECLQTPLPEPNKKYQLS